MKKGILRFRPRQKPDKIVSVPVTLRKALPCLKFDLEKNGHEFVSFDGED